MPKTKKNLDKKSCYGWTDRTHRNPVYLGKYLKEVDYLPPHLQSLDEAKWFMNQSKKEMFQSYHPVNYKKMPCVKKHARNGLFGFHKR
jgi:hypothetical protein